MKAATKKQKNGKMDLEEKRQELTAEIEKDQQLRIKRFVAAYQDICKQYRCQMIAQPKFVVGERSRTWMIQTGLTPVPTE